MGHGTGIRPIDFFRSRLLNCRSVEAIQGLVKSYERDQKELRRHIASILWHMRGGVTREEGWALSPAERRDMMHLIEERVKVVEKTGLPLL